MKAVGVMLKWEQLSYEEKARVVSIVCSVVAGRVGVSPGLLVKRNCQVAAARGSRGVVCQVLLDLGLMTVEVAEAMGVTDEAVYCRIKRAALWMGSSSFGWHVSEAVAEVWVKLDNEGGEG